MSAPTSDRDTVTEAVTRVLREHPDVAEVIIFPAPPVSGRPRTVVAVVPKLHGTAVDIRDALWDALPPHALPDAVAVVPELPRDEAGRVRTDQLARDTLDQPGSCGFETPATPTEVGLAEVWSGVLGRRRVAAGDNFLDLGGDSMTATLLLDLTNERFGVDLSFDELLSLPSLRAIAEAIDARGGAAARRG